MGKVDHPDDVKFWFLGVHNKQGKEIYRKDIPAGELSKFIRNDKFSKDVTFSTTEKPDSWTIWPYSEKKKWMKKLQQSI